MRAQTVCRPGCGTLLGISLLALYLDATLRVAQGFLSDGFGPLLQPLVRRRSAVAESRALAPAANSSSAPAANSSTANARLSQAPVSRPAASTAVSRRDYPPHEDVPAEGGDAGDGCDRHDGLLGNLYSDLAPWVDMRLQISEANMSRLINFVGAHRGRWNSWVSDTLTPLLIKDGRVYLTLGPPTKDPTNYFWVVLMELQQACTVRSGVGRAPWVSQSPSAATRASCERAPASRMPAHACMPARADLALTSQLASEMMRAGTPLPDAELLLNFADDPIVRAEGRGAPSLLVPVFSYCKRDGHLDILVPGYYTPDRVCATFRGRANRDRRWEAKRERVFARYTHFCKFTSQRDEFARKLPPCARSYFASLARGAGAGALDVAPLNVVNDSTDPSLDFGHSLLAAGKAVSLEEHGAHKYLLDTDGFTSAYKLQQLLGTNSVVLHHRSVWRSYFYRSLHPWVHYVPLWESSADDVLRILDWLRAHDGLARRIARNAQHFACEHLTRPARACYWRRAIVEYSRFMGYVPSLARRPRAFPLERLNLMCRIRDGPVVCYYNVKPPGPALPDGYVCEKPVPDFKGAFEECWYRGKRPAAEEGA